MVSGCASNGCTPAASNGSSDRSAYRAPEGVSRRSAGRLLAASAVRLAARGAAARRAGRRRSIASGLCRGCAAGQGRRRRVAPRAHSVARRARRAARVARVARAAFEPELTRMLLQVRGVADQHSRQLGLERGQPSQCRAQDRRCPALARAWLELEDVEGCAHEHHYSLSLVWRERFVAGGQLLGDLVQRGAQDLIDLRRPQSGGEAGGQHQPRVARCLERIDHRLNYRPSSRTTVASPDSSDLHASGISVGQFCGSSWMRPPHAPSLSRVAGPAGRRQEQQSAGEPLMTTDAHAPTSARADEQPVCIFRATGLDAVLELARIFLQDASVDDWRIVRSAVIASARARHGSLTRDD